MNVERVLVTESITVKTVSVMGRNSRETITMLPVKRECCSYLATRAHFRLFRSRTWLTRIRSYVKKIVSETKKLYIFEIDCKQIYLRSGTIQVPSHSVDHLNLKRTLFHFKEQTLVRCAKEGACVYVDHVTAIPSVPQIPTNATVERSANVMITPVITLRISFVEVLFCFLVQ